MAKILLANYETVERTNHPGIATETRDLLWRVMKAPNYTQIPQLINLTPTLICSDPTPSIEKPKRLAEVWHRVTRTRTAFRKMIETKGYARRSLDYSTTTIAMMENFDLN
jgi:hypothetical protein